MMNWRISWALLTINLLLTISDRPNFKSLISGTASNTDYFEAYRVIYKHKLGQILFFNWPPSILIFSKIYLIWLIIILHNNFCRKTEVILMVCILRKTTRKSCWLITNFLQRLLFVLFECSLVFHCAETISFLFQTREGQATCEEYSILPTTFRQSLYFKKVSIGIRGELKFTIITSLKVTKRSLYYNIIVLL